MANSLSSPDDLSQSDSRPSEALANESEIRVRLFARTDVGQVREHNEDNFLVADLTSGSRGLLEANRATIVGPRGALFAVCDGMGGAAAGEVASQLAVDLLFEKMVDGNDARIGRDDLARKLVSAVETAGLRIFQEAKADRTRRGMGTTVTAATLVDDHLFLAQVGDSRGYILRGESLVQVTRDQSLVNQLIEAGQLTEEEAENFEHNNIILQALGTSDTVQVDLTYTVVKKGDILLLCSDGLSGMIRFEEIREVLRSSPEPLDMCKTLTERANLAGGHDNVTVIVVVFEGNMLGTNDGHDMPRYQKYSLPEPVESVTVNDGVSMPPPRAHSVRPDPQPATTTSVRPPSLPPSVPPGAEDDTIDIPGTHIPTAVVVLLVIGVMVLLAAAALVLLR